MSVFLECIAADVEDLGLEVDVEEVLAGDEVGSGSGEFKGDVLLVCLLLGEDLDLVGHLLVQPEELLELGLFLAKLLLQIAESIRLKLQSYFMISPQVFDGVIEGGIKSILLFRESIIRFLLSLYHFCSKLIDLRL